MSARALFITALMCASPVRGQLLMDGLAPGGTARLFPFDEAVLDSREPATSLPCAITLLRPELGFDFTFHTGYQVRVRLRDLAGDGDILTSIFRVTPDASPGKPVYFQQKWRVPEISENSDLVTTLEGSIAVNEGDYQIDWLLRDRKERVCSAFWKVAARLTAKEGSLPYEVRSGSVVAAGSEFSSDYEPTALRPEQINVTILLNIGSQTANGVTLRPQDKKVLLSILRGVAGDPRIGNISLTAFNLEQSQVFFQQENTRRINFADLDAAISSLSLGTISVAQLAQQNAEAHFLVQLARERASGRANAVIFLGPKISREPNVKRELLEQLGEASCPVFYLTYSDTPDSYPWPDLIGRAVRFWRGREFNISRPLDLLSAWSKIMSQLGRTRPWRQSPES